MHFNAEHFIYFHVSCNTLNNAYWVFTLTVQRFTMFKLLNHILNAVYTLHFICFINNYDDYRNPTMSDKKSRDTKLTADFSGKYLSSWTKSMNNLNDSMYPCIPDKYFRCLNYYLYMLHPWEISLCNRRTTILERIIFINLLFD